MTFNDDANLVYVLGHFGPYPKAYHEAVADLLGAIPTNLSQNFYRESVENTLEKISKELVTPGSNLNKLIAAQLQ